MSIETIASAALFGVATKTYVEFKKGATSTWVLIRNFISNSFISVGIAYHAVGVVAEVYPDYPSFQLPIAWLSGAIGLNVILGLTSIQWVGLFTKRLGGGK